MLAHVAEEIDGSDRGEPVEVVDDLRRVAGGVEVEDGLHLLSDLLRPRRHRLLRVETAFLRFAAGVADEAGAPADQGDGRVAGELEAAQHQDGNQVADGQAVGGWVEAVVEGDRSALQAPGETFPVGYLVQQAPPLQVSIMSIEVSLLYRGRATRGRQDGAGRAGTRRLAPDARPTAR